VHLAAHDDLFSQRPDVGNECFGLGIGNSSGERGRRKTRRTVRGARRLNSWSACFRGIATAKILRAIGGILRLFRNHDKKYARLNFVTRLGASHTVAQPNG